MAGLISDCRRGGEVAARSTAGTLASAEGTGLVRGSFSRPDKRGEV